MSDITGKMRKRSDGPSDGPSAKKRKLTNEKSIPEKLLSVQEAEQEANMKCSDISYVNILIKAAMIAGTNHVELNFGTNSNDVAIMKKRLKDKGYTIVDAKSGEWGYLYHYTLYVEWD